MGKLEKAKARLRSKPSDYTYTEARYLLGRLGFSELNKGKTSGSRVCFYRAYDKCKIMLHKPLPGDELSVGATRDLRDKLEEMGEL